jgi:hypothetical protein
MFGGGGGAGSGGLNRDPPGGMNCAPTGLLNASAATAIPKMIAACFMQGMS